jgi:hypothetical protein
MIWANSGVTLLFHLSIRTSHTEYGTPQLLGLWRQCTPFLPNRISDKGDHAQNYE